MNSIKHLSITAAGVLLMASATHGAIIYSATTSNSTILSNSGGTGTGSKSLTGATPDLIYSTSHGSTNNSGFRSSSTVNGLLGATLTAADTVVFSAQIDSISAGQLAFNGFEFGLYSQASATAGFRASSDLLIQTKGGTATTIMSTTSFTDAGADSGFDLVESSLEDGFGVTLTANASGYTFEFTDILINGVTGTTTATYSSTLSGSEFVDNFGTGYFAVTAQKSTNTPSLLEIDFNSATIDVVPETSAFLMSALGGLLFLRRRR